MMAVDPKECHAMARELKDVCGLGPHMVVLASDEMSRMVYQELRGVLGPASYTFPAHEIDRMVVPKIQAGEFAAAAVMEAEIVRVVTEAEMVNGRLGTELSILMVTSTLTEYLLGINAKSTIDFGHVKPFEVLCGSLQVGLRSARAEITENLGAIGREAVTSSR